MSRTSRPTSCAYFPILGANSGAAARRVELGRCDKIRRNFGYAIDRAVFAGIQILPESIKRGLRDKVFVPRAVPRLPLPARCCNDARSGRSPSVGSWRERSILPLEQRRASLDFPIFGFGSYGQDSAPRYKVIDFRIPVEIGAVRIRPGDVLFGDIDGVLLVPAEAEVEVFTRALEKARGEKLVRKDIEEGSSAVEAFEKHGIM